MQILINKLVKNFKCFLLIFGCLIDVSTQSSIITCNTEIDVTASGVNVKWQSSLSGELITSSPLCLNSTKMIQSRLCVNGKWKPSTPPFCNFIQSNYDSLIKCPPDFTGIRYKNKIICILITKPQKWNQTCLPYGSDTNIFDLSNDLQKTVIDFINKNYTKFWMPVKRSEKYTPLVWWLLPNWGEPIDFENYKINLNDNHFNGDCLSVDFQNHSVNAHIENCKNEYSILCLYKERPLIKLACSQGSFTTRYFGEQTTCISVKKFERDYQSYEMVDACSSEFFTTNTIEKTFLYENLVKLSDIKKNEQCAVNIINSKDSYQETTTFWNDWINNTDQIHFVNWQTNISVGDITTVNRFGKWNLSPTVKCVVCQDEIEVQEPQISLKFDGDNGKLFLTVLSGNYLWKEDDDDSGVHCFTNTNNELLKMVEIDENIWSGNITYNEITSVHFMASDSLRNIQKDIFELKLYGDGPNYYWCEGHKIPKLHLIKSQKIVAYKKMKGTVFAVLVDMKCYQCNLIYQKSYLKEIAIKYKNILTKSTPQDILNMNKRLIKNVRVMKIESVNMINSMIKILFHISLDSSNDNDDNNDYDIEDSSEEEEANELGVSENILQIYFYKKVLLKTLISNSSPELQFLSLNHTEYCLPESLSIKNNLNWIYANIQETSVPKELCLLSNGIPATRKCLGDYLYGAIWDNIDDNNICENKNDLSYITRTLYKMGTKILNENETKEMIQNITKLITNRTNLIPADLFYLSKVINNIATISATSYNNIIINATNITILINNIMNVNEIVAKKSQITLNTTNIILNAFDNIINKVSYHHNIRTSPPSLPSLPLNYSSDVNSNDYFVDNDDLDDGTIGVITPKLIVYMTDPLVKNISGFALYKNLTKFYLNQTNGDFYDFYIKYLYDNQSIDELIVDDSGLEIATFVPTELLIKLNEKQLTNKLINTTNTIPIEKPPIKIVWTLYYNDILFQENKNITYVKSESIIMSLSIPGYGAELPGSIPIFFKRTNLTYSNETVNPCGFWDFSPNNTDSTGEWSNTGCNFIGMSDSIDPVVLCSCSHLTHFALLVQGTYVHDLTSEDEFVVITKTHQEALDLITLLGCSLSLVGILGIAFTAVMFRSWREKAGVKVLLQLSGAIALQMVLMCCVNTETITINIIGDDKWDNCIILGASLHYSVLVVFSWMLITAYLQFVRYVKVLGTNRPSRFFIKSFIVGWCLPLVPVLLVVLIAPETYIPPVTNSFSNVCYPSGFALYFGVLLPIALIVTANLVIFILVIHSIVRGPDGKIRSTEKELTLSQLRLSIFLFFLLGLSWIFGLAVASKANILFSYLFCLTATIQGFVLFVYFVLMDPTTRHLWTNLLGCTCKSFNKKTID